MEIKTVPCYSNEFGNPFLECIDPTWEMAVMLYLGIAALILLARIIVMLRDPARVASRDQCLKGWLRSVLRICRLKRL